MKITITVNNDAVKYKASENVTFPEALQIFNSALLGMMRQVTAKAPEAKGDLYDMFNVAASRTLEQFAPELELRPNLTSQAILEAENRIIEENRLHLVEPNT